MILFRYLFLQTMVPFGISFALLTFVSSMNIIFNLINLIVDKGVAPYNVGLLLIYLLPQTMASVIPFAVGIAVLMVMVRISMDSEFIVMRAAGISMTSITLPLITFGVLATIFHSFLTLWAQPTGVRAHEIERVRILKSQTSKKIRPKVWNYDFQGKALYVQDKKGENGLVGVFLADQTLKKDSMIIISNSGNLNIDEKNQEVSMKFYDGTVHLTNEEPEQYRLIHFKSLNYVFDLPDITFESGHIWGVPTLKLIGLDQTNAQVELLLRLTQPFTCLALAIAMITLGITNPRTGKAGAYLYALLLLIIYYILFTGIFHLARESDNNITPHVLWIPPILLSCFGLYNLYKFNYNYSNIFEIIRQKGQPPIK